MNKIDWSKAPEWATCVVKRPGMKADYHWSEEPINNTNLCHIQTGSMYNMGNPNCWEIVEKRPNRFDWSKAPEWATCVVRVKGVSGGYHWSEKPAKDAQMMHVETGSMYTMKYDGSWQIVEKRPEGFATGGYVKVMNYSSDQVNVSLTPGEVQIQVNDDRFLNDLKRSSGSLMETHPNCRCTFTPVEQPSTAPDLLKQAAQLLAERGQQYDKEGEERSAAAIVAAFNAITKRDLTPGEGWLFLVLLKAVRFYSNTETPHRDSLEDMIAYAALHAEEYIKQ